MIYPIKVGSTSQRILVEILDSASTTGGRKAGLAYNTASLTAYYLRSDAGNASATAITLATATKGTFTSGGFVEYDATNMPGIYEIGIPNTALASGATYVLIVLKGASGMVQCNVLIPLLAYDPYDSVRLGLTALPNAAAAATGGLPTVDSTNSVKVQTSLKKNTALAGFTFPLVNSAGTAVTGATVTATRSLDGAAFGSCTNSVSELANGWYKIDLAAGDLNANVVALRFVATGAVDTRLTLLMQP